MSNVLLVENHAPTREFVANVLRSAGHAVRFATEMAAAWELVAAEHPDVLAVSLHHPDAAPLVARAREVAPEVQVLVYDHGHLGNLLGKQVAVRLRPDAYVEDVSQRELAEQVTGMGSRRVRRPVTQTTFTLAVLARPPTVQGAVKDATIPATLLMLLRTFRDGVLVLQQGELERRIFLRLGAPVAFESTERSEAFDRWLFEQGKITEAQLGEALRERAGGALSLPASLVAVGALEPGASLIALLREHLQAMLAKSVGVRSGRFRFHAGDEFLPDVQPVEVPHLAHLLAGARANLPIRTFVAALLPDRERYPRRNESFAEHLPHLALNSKDLRVALQLNGELSTHEMLHTRKGELREVASLLWFLRLVDVVSFDYSRRQAAPGAAPSLPPEKLKPLSDEQLQAIREGALAILPSTYFHALGVDIAATADEVEAAYLKATEALHPDRFAGFDLSEVEDFMIQVQDKLGAAQRTLSSPEKRQGYIQHILARAGDLRGGRELSVPAEVAMKEAERALRARKPTDAVARAREAVQLNSKEPDFHAALALLELLDRSRSDADRRAAAKKAAKRALQLEPEHARAMVALAMLAREEGDATEARKQVLAALKLRPRMELARWFMRELNRVP